MCVRRALYWSASSCVAVKSPCSVLVPVRLPRPLVSCLLDADILVLLIMCSHLRGNFCFKM